MDLQVWYAFLLGTLIICGSPGPNMLQVMASSARYGFRHSLQAMAGCFIPVFLYICISLAGVGAVLKNFPMLFDLLRYAGAAYLIYLGVMAWCTVGKNEGETQLPVPEKLFSRSLMVGISNPKAILFATAYFPQFINLDAPQTPQFLILLATFSIVEISWYLVYAFGGRSLTALLRQAKIQQRFNRLTGTIFAGFGILMIARR